MRVVSLEGRQSALLVLTAALGVVVYLALTRWPLPQVLAWLGISAAPLAVPWLAAALALALLVPLCLWLAHRSVRPLARMLRALEGAVASYRDGDFSISIANRRRDELGRLIAMHNDLGRTLRAERQNLAERELLLDTVVQNTPVSLLLVDGGDHVTYANLAARHLLNDGRKLAGMNFDGVLDGLPESMREAIRAGRDTLFGVTIDGHEETFHVSRRAFRLQGRPHRLYLLRRMTRELSRQEVVTWKRVIRVISHELNNSLAPISSLAHSGAELARRGDVERLPAVFATIADRSRHLHGFIDGYARFAKLPAPRIEDVDWRAFVDGIGLHCAFRLVGALPDAPGRFDAAQIEQVVINLVKNAHEAGGDDDEVTLVIHQAGGESRIEVADRGRGMSEAVLAQALLPFYSTKRAGTGLGLALAREIAEAHGGRIALANRDGGGLCVTLTLPA